MKKTWAVLIGLLMLALMAPPTALADSPADLANKLGTTHVWVDPAASPKLEGAEQVSQQIADTEQKLAPQFDSRSPLKGIFVVDTTDDSVTVDNLRQALADKNGGFSGAIVLINHHGYQHAAYNVSKGWAAANNVLFDQARDAHRGDVYGTVTGYLVLIRSVTPDWAPPAPPPSKPMDWSGLWTALWWTLGLVFAGACVWGLVLLGRRAREKREERDSVDGRLVAMDTHLTSLSTDVLTPGAPDISRYHTLASTLYGSARDAAEERNYAMADHYLTQAEKQAALADKMLNPDLDKIAQTPAAERYKAKVTATATDGKPVQVRNDDYSRRRHGIYQHPYQGGLYNDVYFYPGYYPYPFWLYSWGPSDVIVQHNETVPDNWGGDYTTDEDYASSGSRISDFVYSPTPSDYASSGAASSGFDSGSSTPEPSHHHSSSSSSSSSDSSSYSSPSYDSGSSFSSFDSGGFSGGGFDSGSSSSGF